MAGLNLKWRTKCFSNSIMTAIQFNIIWHWVMSPVEKKVLPLHCHTRIEAFTANELDKIFLGNKPWCQLWTEAHNWQSLLPGKILSTSLLFIFINIYIDSEKCCPCSTPCSYKRSGGIAPHILYFGSRCGWVVNIIAQPLYPQWKNSSIHWIC